MKRKWLAGCMAALALSAAACGSVRTAPVIESASVIETDHIQTQTQSPEQTYRLQEGMVESGRTQREVNEERQNAPVIPYEDKLQLQDKAMFMLSDFPEEYGMTDQKYSIVWYNVAQIEQKDAKGREVIIRQCNYPNELTGLMDIDYSKEAIRNTVVHVSVTGNEQRAAWWYDGKIAYALLIKNISADEFMSCVDVLTGVTEASEGTNFYAMDYYTDINSLSLATGYNILELPDNTGLVPSEMFRIRGREVAEIVYKIPGHTKDNIDFFIDLTTSARPGNCSDLEDELIFKEETVNGVKVLISQPDDYYEGVQVCSWSNAAYSYSISSQGQTEEEFTALLQELVARTCSK